MDNQNHLELSRIIDIPSARSEEDGREKGGEKIWMGGPEATSGTASGAECIVLCVALLSKMASSSELLEYSSPAKRRKVDGSDHGSIGDALVDPVPGVMAHDSPHDDLEGIRML